MKRDEFVNIKLSHSFIGAYVARKAVLDAIKKNTNNFGKIHLDLGCGSMPYKNLILSNGKVEKYIGIDLKYDTVHDTSKVDMYWDGRKIPLPNESVDSIHATEVLEHCSNIEEILKEIKRVLVPGGFLLFTVPFIWPLHEIPHDEYRYTPFSLKRHLNNSGFSDFNLEPSGGHHASLAQMLGLWVTRSNLPKIARIFFKIIFIPIIKTLLIIDKKTTFIENTMMIGIIGSVRK
jgi:SAM-dependent methyltransferase